MMSVETVTTPSFPLSFCSSCLGLTRESFWLLSTMKCSFRRLTASMGISRVTRTRGFTLRTVPRSPRRNGGHGGDDQHRDRRDHSVESTLVTLRAPQCPPWFVRL